jgi:hypothetical protein
MTSGANALSRAHARASLEVRSTAGCSCASRLAARRASPRRVCATRFRQRSPCSRRPSPSPCRPGSSPRVLSSSSEFLRPPSWRCLSARPFLPGSLPASRHPRRCPVDPPVACVRLRVRPLRRSSLELSDSRAVSPWGFAPPRRLAPPSAPRACFIPLPRPGFLSVQGLLPPRSLGSSSLPRASVPFFVPCCPPDRPCGSSCVRHPRRRRLRGLAPRCDAFSSAR